MTLQKIFDFVLRSTWVGFHTWLLKKIFFNLFYIIAACLSLPNLAETPHLVPISMKPSQTAWSMFQKFHGTYHNHEFHLLGSKY